MSERYETTVHDKRTGMPVRGCDGDEIAKADRRREALREIARRAANPTAGTAVLDNYLAACFKAIETLARAALGDTEHE